MLAEFDLAIPSSLEEALEALAANELGTKVVPLAGGTNVIVDLRARRFSADKLVSLRNLQVLRGIRVGADCVAVGGQTTVSDILQSQALAEIAPSLVEQAKFFGGQMVRNAATIAGNVCCGSPAADLVFPLLALAAEVTLVGKRGSRKVPLSDFYLDYKKDVRRPDELMTEISWLRPKRPSANFSYKLGLRKGDAITVVGIAAALSVQDGRCVEARIAMGAVAPYARRAKAAEAILIGETLTPKLIDAAAIRASEEAEPIDDIRASAEYRRHGVRVLTRRMVTQAWTSLTTERRS